MVGKVWGCNTPLLAGGGFGRPLSYADAVARALAAKEAEQETLDEMRAALPRRVSPEDWNT